MKTASLSSPKWCFKCGEFKRRTEFYKHNKMADGLLGKCKDCTKADTKAHRAGNERVKLYDRQRAKLPHNRERRKLYSRARKKEADAHRAVHKAIADGRLSRPDRCSTCDKSCVPDGHHEDYDRQLDVIWLCRSCHRQLHADRGEEFQ